MSAAQQTPESARSVARPSLRGATGSDDWGRVAEGFRKYDPDKKKLAKLLQKQRAAWVEGITNGE